MSGQIMTPQQYHADRSAWSKSMLDEYRENGPEYCYGRFFAKTIPEPESTAALRLGSAFHCLVGEPEQFDARFLTGGPVNPKTGRCYGSDTKAFSEWVSANAAGRTVLSPEEFELAKQMADAVRREAKALVECEGVYETPIYWTDEFSGVRCKCLPDKVCMKFGRPTAIVDWKSTRNPFSRFFWRDAAARGYHRQAALYQDGVSTAHGSQIPFLFVAVRSSAPFEVVVHQMSQQGFDCGRQENAADLAAIAIHQRTGLWRHSEQTGVRLMEFYGWNTAKLTDIEKFAEFTSFEDEAKENL